MGGGGLSPPGSHLIAPTGSPPNRVGRRHARADGTPFHACYTDYRGARPEENDTASTGAYACCAYVGPTGEFLCRRPSSKKIFGVNDARSSSQERNFRKTYILFIYFYVGDTKVKINKTLILIQNKGVRRVISIHVINVPTSKLNEKNSHLQLYKIVS